MARLFRSYQSGPPRIQVRKVVHQHPVDEDVASADFAQEYALGRVVEEGDQLQREEIPAAEYKPEGEMLDDCKAAKIQPTTQPT